MPTSLPFKIDLTDKVTVITGANSPICGEISSALAECGALVSMIDFQTENAERYSKEINHNGHISKVYKVNLIDKQSVEQTHKKIKKEFGSCDILINATSGNNINACTTFEYYLQGDITKDIISFFDLDHSSIEMVFNQNFISNIIPTQIFSKDMISKKGCSIINLSSINAMLPLTKIPAFAASKAATTNFTKWLAVHFSKVGIRVNAIAPGFFITSQNQNILINEKGMPTQKGEKILINTPLERFGVPEEIIGTLLFLASSKASSYITGVVIPVDGGYTAYSGV